MDLSPACSKINRLVRIGPCFGGRGVRWFYDFFNLFYRNAYFVSRWEDTSMAACILCLVLYSVLHPGAYWDNIQRGALFEHKKRLNMSRFLFSYFLRISVFPPIYI